MGGQEATSRELLSHIEDDDDFNEADELAEDDNVPSPPPQQQRKGKSRRKGKGSSGCGLLIHCPPSCNKCSTAVRSFVMSRVSSASKRGSFTARSQL